MVEHHADDVVAGAALGTFFGTLIWYFVYGGVGDEGRQPRT